jgi:hypothetical protein
VQEQLHLQALASRRPYEPAAEMQNYGMVQHGQKLHELKHGTNYWAIINWIYRHGSNIRSRRRSRIQVPTAKWDGTNGTESVRLLKLQVHTVSASAANMIMEALQHQLLLVELLAHQEQQAQTSLLWNGTTWTAGKRSKSGTDTKRMEQRSGTAATWFRW